MFNKEELLELKFCLNEMISSRLVYLQTTISKEEKKFTEEKLNKDYELLEKILNLLNE